ncbi:MAG: alpha/beta hydrolase [Halobacteriovoraceae bacterium]|jgi:non-heme chloroperoxidase|nr:alpha/beta hydrolase [Halobacteriovoraceae bacterium]
MKDKFNHFFKTSDGEQVFYSTNFSTIDRTKNVLIFNYGLVCSNYHWQKQIAYFDKLGYPILTYDYRGHYQSSGKHELEKITFNQLSLDLNELIDFLKLDDVILFGHSMGVNVCLEFAKLFPKKVKKMILISGTIIPVHNIMMDTHLTGPFKPIISKVMEKFPKEFNAFWKYGGWNPLIKKAIHTGGFNVEQVNNEFIEVYLNKLGQLGPDLFFHLIDQMHEHDILAFVEKIKTKTLVIGGNRDKVIPNFSQKLMHSKLQNAELYTIHTGSHVPQVDFPKFANERIEFFVQAKK